MKETRKQHKSVLTLLGSEKLFRQSFAEQNKTVVAAWHDSTRHGQNTNKSTHLTLNILETKINVSLVPLRLTCGWDRVSAPAP